MATGSTLIVYNGTGNAATPATCTMPGVLTAIGTAVVSYTGAGGCTLLYSGTFTQTATAGEFPTVANLPTNLTINNGLGVSFPPVFNRTIPGNLRMISGNLSIGAGNTLSLTNLTLSNQLIYTGGFITLGTLSRLYPSSGLPTATGSTSSLFPFGTGSNDRSLNIYFSAASLSAGGTIAVSHTPVVGVLNGLSLSDNGVTIDKRTLTFWSIGTAGGFTLGGTTASVTAVGANIGAIDNIVPLRLTDGVTPNLGVLIPSMGSTSVPVVGKSNLTALNTNLYVGSDGLAAYNPLTLISYTWTGSGGNSNWTNVGNWIPTTAGYPAGFPNASTEEAIITSTSGSQPIINTGDNISIYRITVGIGMSLTMMPGSIINVYDVASFAAGTTAFDAASTFTYSSFSTTQNVLDLTYGNLSFSGTAGKFLPTFTRVRGKYTISGASPDATANLNTFIYEGSGSQQIWATTPIYSRPACCLRAPT